MPELPEVHTTVTGLQKVLPGLTIHEIWSDMWSTSTLAKNTIKDRSYFSYFKKYTLNQKILSVTRRAKYILIHLENGFTIIIHMKMTGHLMVGKWKLEDRKWKPKSKNSPLSDPYNRHIHVVFTLSDQKQMAFCDSRKFGTIVVQKTSTLHTEKLSHLGPEPLEEHFTKNNFKERLFLSPKRVIKTVLMDQTIIAGIGNIYSDEMLYISHILPTRSVKSLKDREISLLFKAMKKVLFGGILFGGDSKSDYRNVHGERGNFQTKHKVYLRTGEVCKTKGCGGIIKKLKVGGRSAHFCGVCQK